MPQLARVLGTVWATGKYPGMEGSRMQLIQPLTCEGKADGIPLAAVDTVGAGPGEVVMYMTAYEAVIACKRPMTPIDAAIVGIVEQVDNRQGFTGEI